MTLKNLAHNILYTLSLLMIMVLAGCGSEPLEVVEPDPEPIFMSTGKGMSFDCEVFSRDGSSSEDDQDSRVAIKPETAGLYGEMHNYMYDIFDNQIVYWKKGETYKAKQSEIEAQFPTNFRWPDDNDWVYVPIRSWSGSDYQFYCYAPHSSTEGTNVTLTANSYKAMTSFLETHIPPYSSYDYTVASTYKFQRSGVVPFVMKHISARICIRIKIGEKYSELRKIKVKRITVKDRVEGSTYFQCLYTLNEDEGQNTMTVTSNGSYTPSGEDIFVVPIFEDADGLELRSDKYQQYGSLYVMPQNVPSLTLNITYDVYDHKSNDPVRRNAQVSNTISLFKDVESGKYYNINIVVSPEYLYVLSDNDIKPDLLISPEPENDPGTDPGSEPGTDPGTEPAP